MTDAHGKGGASERASTWRGTTSWQYSVMTGALTSPLISTWGQQALFKRHTRLFQQETQTPNGIQKMLVSLPSLEEPQGSEGLVKTKGTCAGHLACITSLHPNSTTFVSQMRKMRRVHGQTAVSRGTMIWTYISHLPMPKLIQLCHAVSHRDGRHVPKRKAGMLRMNRK